MDTSASRNTFKTDTNETHSSMNGYASPETINGADDEINVGEVFSKAFFHWPLYLLFFLASIVAAYLFLRYSKPVYSSTAKIYIKDEKKSGGAGKLSAMDDFSFLGGSKLVENEMEVIKSPLILTDVIRDHQFNIRYFAKGRVTEYELYDQLPIKLTILTDSTQVGNYFLDINREGDSGLNIKYKDLNKTERSLRTRFSQAFNVGKDRFLITYNPIFDPRKLTGFQVQVDSILQLAYQKAEEISTQLVNKQSSVFEITYRDGVAKRSADFLNAVAQKYNQYSLEDKNQTAANTIKFIETRLQSLGGELGSIERDVESFKKTRGITEIKESSRLFLEQVKEADQKLNEADIQLSVYDQIDRYVSSGGNNAAFAPLLGNVDAALTSLINRYQELQSERKKLSLSLQPNNPIQENIDQQIADTRSTIKNYIAGYRRNAQTAKAGLQRKVNQVEGLIAQVPGYEREFINLSRQQGVKEALYLYLLQKKEESAVTYASNIVDNKIISPAYIPLNPISPKKPLIFIAFIAGAVIVTSGYLYLKYLLSNKITSKHDIEKIISYPIVAEIYKDEGTTEKLALNSAERTVLTEQILNLRNNLKFALNNVQRTPVILFTSSISGEGKSFLSAHLAASLTYNNKRVVMMELDLRKPKLAKSVGIDNSSGITNFIIGQESQGDIIKEVKGVERLFLIPSGPIPPNPIELLESDKIKTLIQTLRETFDYIVIDTSPIGLVSDAKSLSPMVDYSLFICRFNYTPKEKLKEVAANLHSDFFKKVGIVFNGIDVNSSYSQYGYGYSRYSYGYGDKNNSRFNGFKEFIKDFKKRLA